MQPKTWNQAVEELFADEEKLASILREFNAFSPDTEATLGFINYAVENKWECPVVDGYFINAVTGERISTKELRARYQNSIKK